jgi:ribosomal protein S18 acetylase RimI-like enzyme
MEIITDLKEYNLLKKMINKDDRELTNFDKKSTYYIYFFGSRPAGRITIQNKRNKFVIWDIFVSETMRGKGICSKMLGEVINPGKNYILYVKDNNEPAIKCYKKFGFTIIEHKKGVFTMSYDKMIGGNTEQNSYFDGIDNFLITLMKKISNI